MGLLHVALLIVILVLILICVYFVMIYNNLIALKNNIAKNWSNIDVLLKQRNSELSKLIDTCSAYMKYEQETLDKIVKARNVTASAREYKDINKLGQAEGELLTSLRQLFALAERYPELKANESYQLLETRISELETALSDRRELYNDSVNLNNIRINIFPDLIIARLFHFKKMDLLKFREDEMSDVNINSTLKVP